MASLPRGTAIERITASSAGRKVKRIRREAVDEFMKRTEKPEDEGRIDRRYLGPKPRRDHFT